MYSLRYLPDGPQTQFSAKTDGDQMINTMSRKIVWALALGGFIPFGGLAIVATTNTILFPGVSAVIAFLIWSLVILSFLGGIRWGLALNKEPLDLWAICISVIPCIIGWFSLLLPVFWTVVVLAVLYLLHGYWDVRSLQGEPQSWFASVRTTLTVLVSAAHVLVLVSLV